MNDKAREAPGMAAVAERRMRSFELAREIAEHFPRPNEPATRVGPYVAISREAGTSASEIAETVGERLGWKVLDKNLLECVARHLHSTKDVIELVDETANSWVYDVLGTWLDPGLVPHERYVAQLTRIMLAAGRRGKVVIVGRGAWLLLPRAAGLAVRIVAPREYRINRIMQVQHLDAAQARAYAERVDEGRRLFVRQHFHRDIDDPHLYDMVINVGQLGTAGVVEQILLAVKSRG